MIISTLDEWLNESVGQEFLEPTSSNLSRFDLEFRKAQIYTDGSISYDGDVNLSNKGLTKLPFKFRNVSGYFECSLNKLENLEGSPVEVGKNFNCSWNNLTSLKECPVYIGGNFDCSGNNIIDIKEKIEFIDGNFDCSSNHLLTLPRNIRYIQGDLNIVTNPIAYLDFLPNVNGRVSMNNYMLLYNGLKDSPEFSKFNFKRSFPKEYYIRNNISFSAGLSIGSMIDEVSFEEYFQKAFDNIHYLQPEEIVKVADSLEDASISEDLKRYAFKQIFKSNVKYNPKTKFQKALSGTEDEIIDMF